MQAVQLEATQIDFESPLKPSASQSLPKNNGIVPRKKLFGDDVVMPERTLSELYNFELDKPPFEDVDRQFFKVRDLVSDIETVLKSFDAVHDTAIWREKISRQLPGKNFDKKMAELGAILFYIAKNGDNLESLAAVPSLLAYRAKELKQEVDRYIQSTQSVGSDSCIPSGKIHYLMRAFAHMVLTKDHVYNRGGLIAIRELLSDPQYRIAKYLQPEHRDHILIVIKELLAKPSTVNVFNQPVTIAESLKDLIRIDLKLQRDSPINSTFILYDCLMALFADVRQFEYPNCYAVASLVYATENHTNKTLVRLLEWLKTGYYSFESNTNIPIYPLVNGRLTFCRDFTISVNSQAVFAVAPLEHIQSTLHLKVSSTTVGVQQPLGKALKVLLEGNNKEEQFGYVTKLYNGYKYNALIDMQMAIIEFENANSRSGLNIKDGLVCTCITTAQRSRVQKLTRDQVQKLGEKLYAKLWLQPCYEKKVRKPDGSILVGSLEVFPASGNDFALYNLLNESIRVFTLKKDAFCPVFSITDLRNLVKLTMNELGISGTIDARVFADEIVQFCKTRIHASFAVPARTLKNHDLLAFSQDGGFGDVALDHVYKISVSTQKISDSGTPYQFLEKLFGLFKAATLKKAVAMPKFLISSARSPNSHAWTINTSCWKIFSACTNSFQPFMQRNVFYAAHARLDSVISIGVVGDIILRYTSDKDERKALADFLGKLSKPTYRAIRDSLKKRIPRDRAFSMRAIVDEEFSKITMNKKMLSTVLHNLGVAVSTEMYEKIYCPFSPERSLPFILARELRLALIEHKIAVLDPQDVEMEICRAAHIPIPINLGDLNWTDKYTEDPVHTTLWIRYSYWDATPGYYIRRNASETRDLNRYYRHIRIYHPKL